MAKGYWIVCYRAITDDAALARYASLAGPAVAAAGGRYLVRGKAERACEAGIAQRVVIIEFDSVEAAIATYEGPAYQAALAALGGAAERDLRIVAGV